MKPYKLLLGALGATVLLGALVSTASARNLQLTNQTWRSTFREIRFRLPFGDTVCPATLEGTFHSRTIAKVAGSLIGYVTRAAFGAPCTSGTATVLAETLPWHVRYLAFSGTLPEFINSIRVNVVDVSFRVREPGLNVCLVRSTAAEPVLISFARENGGAVLTAELAGTIRTGAECFGEAGTLSSDRGPVTVLNSTARITVTLI
ncbi:MAG: hypothetical protein ACTHOE_04820 [Conexibacter sp.]